MSILIMDSDPETIKQCTSILEKNEFRTLSAQSVKQAVALLQSHLSISMIFAEINTPQDDGFELLRFLRANLRFSHIPVIVCTATADSRSVVRSAGLGAKDYIAKPINEEKLLSKVNRILEARRGTVLIVGKDELTVKILAQTLDRGGYNGLIALSTQVARELLEAHHVHLVISDLYLDEISGLDLLAEIKEKNWRLPVILIAHQSAGHSEADLIAAGADGCIKKPFNNTDIINKMLTVMRKKVKKGEVTKRTRILKKMINLNIKSE